MHSYVIFLRSWITDTDYVISESKPLTIDTSPPQINRGKTIIDSLDNCATHSNTGKSFHALRTCWDGVFSDQQSGIKNYNIFVGTVPGGHDVSGILNIGLELNFTWHFSNLHPGVKYFSTIQAVNNVGLQTTLFSSGFLIDNTSPSVGIVYNTAFFQNIPWQPFSTSLTATWQGFTDHESFISSYFVALVDSGGNVIKDFENVGIRNKHTLSNLTLNVQKQYNFLVKAQNSVGLKSNAVSSHQISFDVSKPKGMKCKLYSQVIYNITISSIAKENFISEQINVTKGQYRFKVQIHTLHKFWHDSIHIYIEDTNHEIPTDDLENGFHYLSSTEKTVNVLVDITTLRMLNDNFTIRLTGEKCVRLEEANDNAVTVRQISPSHVTISVFIVDEESEITSVDVLVGTIRNAQQIAHFSMHTGIFVRTIHILQQQATPITVSVFAKNGAGLQENFYALPIALDHTAPVLVVKDVFVSYETDNTEVKSIFTIRWNVEEKESDIQECFCAWGSFMGSDTIIPWFESENRTECRSPSMRLPHGTEVFASVKCVNTIGLSSEVNDKNVTIVAYKAPIPTQPEVTFAVNSIKMMLLEHIQHSTTSLYFHWLSFQDATGLINYNFCIKSDNNIVLNSADIGKHNYVSIDDLDLQYNGTYIADVYAVNSVGKRSDSINGSIKVLDIAPIQTGKTCNISMDDGKLNVTWNGVFQLDTRIDYSYTVFIGSQAGYADIVRSMKTKDDSVIVQIDMDIRDVFIVITAEYAGRFQSTYREHKQIL
ncbi:uncharacterized protein LOC134250179 [Saccostrea cucullata]|uniref:uncharacterized protein LOC134250179 n=1 Tax=Saccostrea cuccullata TaxID=36930 RepID=UPI002ED132F3